MGNIGVQWVALLHLGLLFEMDYLINESVVDLGEF